jgi:dinuclear metal center YbgI/SA1388 family protein
MATEIAQIVTYLDGLLGAEAFREEEPENGLMLDAGRPATRIGAAVNTSFFSIRRAVKEHIDLLLVHHASWPYIDFSLKDRKEEILTSAGISLYSAHASLDCAPEVGTADSLARLVGLGVEGRFAKYGAGLAGVYGQVEGTFSEFVLRAEQALGVPVESWGNADAFGRVGLVTGAGGMTNMLEEARALGCDTYLTGEGSMYTKLFAREVGMNLVLGTHYATEAPGVKALADHVGRRFELPWEFIPDESDIL